MTREEYLRAVQQIYTEWEPTAVAGAQPDPRYANNDPTQYPESIVAVSATPEDDTRYWAKVAEVTALFRGQSVT